MLEISAQANLEQVVLNQFQGSDQLNLVHSSGRKAQILANHMVVNGDEKTVVMNLNYEAENSSLKISDLESGELIIMQGGERLPVTIH